MENKPLTMQEIVAKIAVASAAGDITEVVKLGNQLRKFQSDIQAAEAKKLQAEAEALAGVRQEAANQIFNYTRKMKNLDELMASTKATGFTYKSAYQDKNGVTVDATVALTVPVIKEKRVGGGGGGGTGVTVASLTGIHRRDFLEKYATDEEKARIAKAREDAAARGGNPNSSGWSAEQPVVKRILAEHPELIKK